MNITLANSLTLKDLGTHCITDCENTLYHIQPSSIVYPNKRENPAPLDKRGNHSIRFGGLQARPESRLGHSFWWVESVEAVEMPRCVIYPLALYLYFLKH